MSVGFIRRTLDTPSIAFLLAIEGVVIVDRAPPEFVQGVGSGEVEMIGEYEDGPFGVHTAITSGPDLQRQFGGFGFIRSGVEGYDPCARARNADAAVNPEYWNGNGFIALVNKKFGGLTVCRVDTSVGSVSFSRQASLTGLPNFSFTLSTGQTLVIALDGGGPLTATFTGVAATVTSGNGVFPSTFAGGEQITYKIDGITYQTIFLASDQSHAAIVARLNATVGYLAFVAAALTTVLTGRTKGTSGSVQIVSIDALVATATGFVAAGAVAGTGNVPNIAAVTDADAHTVIVAAVPGTKTDRDAAGNIRITDTATPLSGTIQINNTSTATGFGFTFGVLATAALGVAGSIPAGTVVKTAGAVRFVTMQTLNVTAAGADPYTVKVRHALDDGTGASQIVSALAILESPIALGAFAVTNNLPITAALTEAALDAAYVLAINSSSSVALPTKVLNFVLAARQSNAIRSALKAIGPVASANGCLGRQSIIRPPLGTSRAAALSSVAQPGVGTYRDNLEGRTIYAYPGVNTFVPQIAKLGTAGGAGFTADGNIDVGFDSWAAAVTSQLNPEENPGQQTNFLALINSVELGNADVQNLQIGDYIAFKAAGIAAFRSDGGDNFIESGVTTADPATYAAIAPISRRRMADFIQDSGAKFLIGYIKKLARIDRKAAAIAGLTAFLEQLKASQNPALARIDDFAIDAKSGNTPTVKKQGIFWIISQVILLPSLDVIVFDTQIGQTVTITIRNAA